MSKDSTSASDWLASMSFFNLFGIWESVLLALSKLILFHPIWLFNLWMGANDISPIIRSAFHPAKTLGRISNPDTSRYATSKFDPKWIGGFYHTLL
jgi:hypothetical protein